MIEKVNLKDSFSSFTEHWTPKIAGELNGQHVKLAKLKGEFVWHKHDNEDELFIVFKGQLTLQLRSENIVLNTGEMYVVPAGVEHRPVAKAEAHLLLIEPSGTPNTGDHATAAKREEI